MDSITTSTLYIVTHNHPDTSSYMLRSTYVEMVMCDNVEC